MILLDANILVRMCDAKDAAYGITRQTVFECRKTDTLAICPQTLYEFWAVATRDESLNGLGMDASRAKRWLVQYGRLFTFLPEPEGLYSSWAALVATHNIKGFRSHDVRYVALMNTLGISKFMTRNVKHFQVFPITIIEPT